MDESGEDLVSALVESRVKQRQRAPTSALGARLPRLIILTIVGLATVLLAVGLTLSWRMGRTVNWSAQVLPALPLLLVLGTGSYSARFVRWHLLVRRLAPRLPLRTSAAIYMAGFGMGLTPGRLGEFMKFTLLRQATGVAEAESVSVFPLERATEATAFVGLAVVGAVVGNLHLQHIGIGALLTIAVLPCLALLPLGYQVLRRRRASGKASRSGRLLSQVLHGLLTISGFRAVLLALLCAAVARTFDTFLFYSAAHAVGLPLTLPMAAFAWGLAGLVGGLSLLPAGVGAVEASLVATVIGLGGDGALALAAALLARLMTLWLWIPPGLWFAFRGCRAMADDATPSPPPAEGALASARERAR